MMPSRATAISAGLLVGLVILMARVARASSTGVQSPPTKIPTLRLNNNVVMPMLSMGIWQFSDAEVANAVPLALSLGITHIDASIFYMFLRMMGGPTSLPLAVY